MFKSFRVQFLYICQINPSYDFNLELVWRIDYCCMIKTSSDDEGRPELLGINKFIFISRTQGNSIDGKKNGRAI